MLVENATVQHTYRTFDGAYVVMGELNVSFIETVILSVPDDQHTLEHIQPLWSALEEQVTQQRVYSVGISDLSKVQLEELYNWATVCY